MTPILRRCFIAGLLFAALAIAPNQLHAQARGGKTAVGGRGAPPATASRSASAAQATAVQDRVSVDLEAKYPQMAEVLQKPIPKRDYKVETGELTKTKLFRADPKLLEKKVVATFSLVIMGKEKPELGGRFPYSGGIRQTDRLFASEQPTGPRFGSDLPGHTEYWEYYPADLRRLIRWHDDSFLFSSSGSTPPSPRSEPLSDQHKHLLDKCDASRRPSPPMIEFLTSADCDRDVARSRIPGDQGTIGWMYRVYAATPDEAEQRVAAILQLLDGGLSWPMREYLQGEGRKSLDAARSIFEEVAKQSAVIQAEEDKLAKPSEISPDILIQLKAQKVMVAVELAGLIARVKACDGMLKDPKKLEISTLQSISDMKVKAEIERVGIKEKLDQINAFIGEGDSRQSTQERIAELKKARNPILNRAHAAEGAAWIYVNLFDLYAPLPLKDNQITISPVEWTN
jgi:hypothetical protein